MQTNKTTRFLIRVTEDQKATLQAAAKAEGGSLSAFVLRAALAAAKKVKA